MFESHKICPSCAKPNHVEATTCTTCGVELSTSNPMTSQTNRSHQAKAGYDYRFGENDLQEGSIHIISRPLTILLLTGVFAIMLISIGMWMLSATRELPPTPIMIASNTIPATLSMATVTTGPPTATFSPSPQPTLTPSITPTRSPCVQYIQQGGNLITAIINCGHRSQDVVPTVLALNNISNANNVRVGQEILIPWPTDTPDPFAVTVPPTLDGELQVPAGARDVLVVDSSISAFAPTATPTLPPGVMWHYVQPDENIIVIAVQYKADVKTLSELNREIDFARCDFGETYGGPECLVQLFQGQAIRVPAPTPTPTLSPTIDPNATATAPATATSNVPSIYSPSDREFFYRNEFVTLRWLTSATLKPGDLYRVDVQDLTSGKSYFALTSELSFTIPAEWQGQIATRHDYVWSVSIVAENNPNTILYQTDSHRFVWQGTVESD